MKADYLIGRRVESVVLPKSTEEWKWAIVLEGDTSIIHMGNSKMPTNAIDNTVLGAAPEHGGKTTLQFYSGSPATLVEEVEVITKQTEVNWPEGQTPLPPAPDIDPTEDLPDDPSPERVAEGPEEPQEPQEPILEPASVEAGEDAPVETESLRTPENGE